MKGKDVMDQIKELQEQIEALKKTVSELQSGTVRVETNTAKLARMKDQIIMGVFPEKMFHKSRCKPNGDKVCLDVSIRKCISPVANELFNMKTEYKVPSFSKMANYIFSQPEPEKVLKDYLDIYRSVCEFMCSQVEDHWEMYKEKG